jgi:hypothetical protein
MIFSALIFSKRARSHVCQKWGGACNDREEVVLKRHFGRWRMN